MKNVLLTSIMIVGALYGVQAFAETSLDLACVTEDVGAHFLKVRRVIIETDGEMVALGSAQASEKLFAIVIELVGGANGKQAEEKSQILNQSDFSLEVDGSIPEGTSSWIFKILKSKIVKTKKGFKKTVKVVDSFVCSINEEAHSLPGFTRINSEDASTL
ncbi:MAG: hypothetical protein JNM39_18220 [Bdellovibrionaceae bacterium]|nr:hypothetical protein [Pseudobdellovibrionaceae bacterium]